MKNSLKYILLAVLIIASIYLYFNNSKSTIKEEIADFAVEDTSAITKIFLADQQGNTILLERIDETKWSVNKEFLARKGAINNLLATIKRVSIKAPVNRAAFEPVVKRLSSKATKVEIYMGDEKPAKVYYVGGPNQEHTGTFMLIEGSSVPYLTHMEGFFGYLTPRYFTNIHEWKDRGIFRYKYGEIQSIQVEHPLDKENSFKINEVAPNKFELIDLSSNTLVENYDTTSILEYITYFKSIDYEGTEETKTPEFIDGIKEGTPEQVYTVTDKAGNIKKVTTFIKPVREGATDMSGTPIYHDQDRMYATINDSNFVIVQYFVFDKLNKKLDAFRK